MPGTARDWPGQKQKPGTHSSFSTQVAGIQVLELLVPPGTQEVGKPEQSGTGFMHLNRANNCPNFLLNTLPGSKEW